MERFEIVICGASVAGALAGYVCARLGRKTVLVNSASVRISRAKGSLWRPLRCSNSSAWVICSCEPITFGAPPSRA